jgi:hypothetical protein
VVEFQRSYNGRGIVRVLPAQNPEPSDEGEKMPRIPDGFLDAVVYLYSSEEDAKEGAGIGGSGFKQIPPLDIGIGDEAFVVGRFINHEGKQRNTPTARTGIISQMPIEPIHIRGIDQECFLIEARSFGGFVAFLHSKFKSIPE